MNEQIINFFSGLSNEWLVIILSAMPVSELRGAIPLGIVLNLTPIKVFLLSILGNMTPVLPLLYLLEPVSERLRKFGIARKFFDWLFARTKKRADLIEKYELLGLALFVAVPLPMTGAWTGCIAASLFKLNKKRSFFAVFAGVLIAAMIVMSVTLGAKAGMK
ncbi:MAG: small multi-drug export protein [Candidatus Omnitrophota bacterium]